jgi:hypothetical protein
MTHVTIAPHVSVRNIYPSAWNRNSANFAFTEFSRKFPSCQRFSRGTISTAPHTTQLRQNAAAKATCTGRMGTKT